MSPRLHQSRLQLAVAAHSPFTEGLEFFKSYLGRSAKQHTGSCDTHFRHVDLVPCHEQRDLSGTQSPTSARLGILCHVLVLTSGFPREMTMIASLHLYIDCPFWDSTKLVPNAICRARTWHSPV